MIALLPFWALRISHNYLRFSGSRPVDGSSRKIILGSDTRAIATERRRFIPPLSDFTGKFLNFWSNTSAMAVSTFSCSNSGSIPLSRAKKSRCSSTVRSLQ